MSLVRKSRELLGDWRYGKERERIKAAKAGRGVLGLPKAALRNVGRSPSLGNQCATARSGLGPPVCVCRSRVGGWGVEV